MPMYNLLWQYYRDKPSSDNTDNDVDFAVDVATQNSKSFKYKQKIIGKTDADGEKNVKIMVPLKYLSNFWRFYEMSLVNYEINLILTWSKKYVIASNTAAN